MTLKDSELADGQEALCKIKEMKASILSKQEEMRRLTEDTARMKASHVESIRTKLASDAELSVAEREIVWAQMHEETAAARQDLGDLDTIKEDSAEVLGKTGE